MCSFYVERAVPPSHVVAAAVAAAAVTAVAAALVAAAAAAAAAAALLSNHSMLGQPPQPCQRGVLLWHKRPGRYHLHCNM